MVIPRPAVTRQQLKPRTKLLAWRWARLLRPALATAAGCTASLPDAAAASPPPASWERQALHFDLPLILLAGGGGGYGGAHQRAPQKVREGVLGAP